MNTIKEINSVFPCWIFGTIEDKAYQIPFGSLDDADFYLDHLIFSARRFNTKLDLQVVAHGEVIGRVQFIPQIH